MLTIYILAYGDSKERSQDSTLQGHIDKSKNQVSAIISMTYRAHRG